MARSSSISSFELLRETAPRSAATDGQAADRAAGWRRFWRWLLGGIAAAIGAVFLFLAIVDPWGSLVLSPDLPRVPADPNQRFSYPMVARDARFDSLVIGTSTTRLLEPERLNRRLGGQFANLSMNSSTAYESYRIADLFLRRQPAPGTLIVGIDDNWCLGPADFERFTDRPFPPWLYDDNRLNDYLHLMHGRAVEIAINQAGMVLGFIQPRFGIDGYANFLPDDGEYDLARAQQYIYGSSGPRPLATPPPGDPHLRDRALQPPPDFPAIDYLERLVERLPTETRLIALVVPYHASTIAPAWIPAGRRLAACKSAVLTAVARHPSGAMVDFMLWSPITREDRHYWDAQHTTTAIADLVVDLLADALAGRPDPAGRYRVLQPD